MLPEITTKRCSRCGAEKPASEFSRDARNRDGLESRCKVCWRARSARYRAENPEKVRARKALYHAANLEKERARKARVARWQAANPEKARANSARRRALMLGAFIEDVSLLVLLERDKGRCGICHKTVAPKDRSIDHVLPLSKGGDHSYANTRLTHLRCNTQRGNRGQAQLRLVS